MRGSLLVLPERRDNQILRRRPGSAFGSGQIEPKWASISSYCKRHKVNWGPFQCRKRWSNLAGDFKNIKEWESKIKEETESHWVMRNDLRREGKLPGFFDREIYDILDGGSGEEDVLRLASEPGPVAEAADEESEALFDSGRSKAADDGLFSDFEQSGQEKTGRSSEQNRETPLNSHVEKQLLQLQRQRRRSLRGSATGQQIRHHPRRRRNLRREADASQIVRRPPLPALVLAS